MVWRGLTGGLIDLVGKPKSADTQSLLNIVRDGYRPFQGLL
jgi:hypothetical protein